MPRTRQEGERMLTRIQIRAAGRTAHEVEGELRWAAARLIADFGLTGELTEQVIEGTPDKSFSGRLSVTVTGPPTKEHAAFTFTPDRGITFDHTVTS